MPTKPIEIFCYKISIFCHKPSIWVYFLHCRPDPMHHFIMMIFFALSTCHIADINTPT